MGKLQVIVGGQFGSEGKGAVAGYLASKEPKLLAIRVGGPNAGHTVYDAKGTRFPLRQIPVAAVTNPDAQLAIGAGSEVDLDVLWAEIGELELHGHAVHGRLLIDTQATLLEEKHRTMEADEALTERIGSTGKGIGAARADRIMRTARLVKDAGIGTGLGRTGSVRVAAMEALAAGMCVQIEAAQGFGLGLHAGYYPYCTSGDCTAIDALAAASLSPWGPWVTEFEVWVVMRTFPIRVAGNSGPLRYETTWEDLNQESAAYINPERTTVTQKIRRVGRWDAQLALRAVAANGGKSPAVKVALTMLDYVLPELANETTLTPNAEDHLRTLEVTLGADIGLVGTGPQTIIDRRGA